VKPEFIVDTHRKLIVEEGQDAADAFFARAKSVKPRDSASLELDQDDRKVKFKKPKNKKGER